MKRILTLSLFVCVPLLFFIQMGSRAEKPQDPASNSQGPSSPPQQISQNNPYELSEQARMQLHELAVEKQSRTSVQQKIDSQVLIKAKLKRHEALPPTIASMKFDVTSDAQGRFEVDISATVTESLLGIIRREGGDVVNSYPQFNAVRAYLPPESLETVAELSEVRVISRAAGLQLSGQATSISQTRPPLAERFQVVQQQLRGALSELDKDFERSRRVVAPPFTGTINSEGDTTHAASQGRATFGANGSGIKIGVISDSVKNLSQSQASGDLPAVTVLSNRSGVDGGSQDSGEGTAMLEIIHDLAPGAQLFFSTGKGSPAAFAQNILDLRTAGCNIIVDDLEYFNESPFQDDVVSQAVNSVTAAGTLYFSSAGNSGNFDDSTSSVWEGDFVDGGPVSYNGTPLGNAHRFFSPSIIFNHASTANPQGESTFLFWSDPLAASANDYDLFIVNSSGVIVRFSNSTQNGTQVPIEFAPIADGEHVLVVKFSGANRYLHVNVGRGRLDYATTGRTKGHSAAVNAFSVAAVKARTSYPNAFTGGSVNPVETFSSDGPRRVFYSPSGVALTPGNFSSTGGTLRAKPDISAADGVTTSVPGFASFYGTSAAAPHAAAIAGLLMSYNPTLTPAQLRTALVSTALDIEASGADRDSGAGIVMALTALQAIATCPANSISPGQTISGVLATSDCYFVGTTRYVDVYSFNGIAGQQIAITMNSSAFDTYLYLLDSSNNLIAQDDDGNGGTNSRIPTNGGFFVLPRTGTFTIYATSFFESSTGAYSINLTSSNCSFSINPTSQIFIASASSGSFSVSTAANCPWTATSNVSWLTTNSSGVGNGIVNYSVAANTGNSRSGTITVSGQMFSVFQSAGNGSGCTSTPIAPGQTINTSLTTGCVFTGTSRYVDPYTFAGSAGQQIAITMSSSVFDTFLFLDSPSSQTIAQNDDSGGGTNSRIPVNSGFFTLPSSGSYRIYATSYSPDGNTGSTGSYAISLLSSTSCSYSIAPTSQSVGPGSSSNSFSITAPAGCAWTALSNAGWITTSSSGSGNGNINYLVASNAGASRSGTISVGNQLFTVNQSDSPRTLTVSSSNPGSGVTITMSPRDNSGFGGGVTQFSRVYGTNTSVSLTAPSSAGGNVFQKWQRDGIDLTTSPTASVVMDTNHTLNAVFVTATTSSIQFSASSYVVNESANFATLTVTRSGNTSAAATVKYTTSDATDVNFNCNPGTGGQITGAASRKCDYHISAGRLRFGAGETSKQIILSIVNDVYVEGSETLSIALSSPVGVTLSTPNSATVTITDNDVAGQPNPIDGTAFYVRMLYVDLLSREPDPAGNAGWIHRIDFCGQPGEPPPPCDRVTVGGDGFLRSAEFFDREFYVIRLYRTALGRIPRYDDVGDLAYVSGFLNASELEQNKQELIGEIMSHSEFGSAYNSLSNSQYVDTMIQTAAVTIPSADRNTWVNALNGGTTTRALVFRELSERAEVSNKYLHEAQVVSCYYGFFTRNPDAAYFNFLQRLDAGQINLGDLANAFINANEYRRRFGP